MYIVSTRYVCTTKGTTRHPISTRENMPQTRVRTMLPQPPEHTEHTTRTFLTAVHVLYTHSLTNACSNCVSASRHIIAVVGSFDDKLPRAR